MKAFCSVTKQFFISLWADAMLVVLICVPLIMGCIFRFGVPLLESYLCNQFDKTIILKTYYPIFDLLLSIMTPIMFTAAGAMVILDELDLGLTRAIAVTPIGRNGYLSSRIVIPSFLSTIYCIIITLIFKLSDIKTITLIFLAICSGVLGIVTSLTIMTFAKNKVEGLAYSKLSGLFVLGLPIALLVPKPIQYISGILPTFWITKLVVNENLFYVIPSIIVSFVWVLFLMKLFLIKSLK